jgi:hypothetical protein
MTFYVKQKERRPSSSMENVYKGVAEWRRDRGDG